MTTPLPEKQPPAAGQRPAPSARTQAEQIVAAVDEVLADKPTRYRDDSPLPTVGATPPVPQPGRPPMSSKAVDDTARMFGASALVGTTGGATALVLWASGHADPVVIGMLAGGPVALVLAIGRLARFARPAPDVHHHYEGDFHQKNNTTNHNRWWGRSTENR